MKVPITQSKMWQKLQEDLGEKSVLKQSKKYQFLAIIKSTPVGNYIYCPYGPVATDQNAFKKAINELAHLALKENAIFVRIEPQERSFEGALPKNAEKTTDLNPKETWVLDLSGDEQEFFARMPSRLLRYEKKAHGKGIAIRQSDNPDDITFLIKLQNALARKKGINTFSRDYLKTEATQPFATLYLVEYIQQEIGIAQRTELEKKTKSPATNPPEIIAAGLVFDDESTRYNLQGAQSDLGRKLHATGILTINLIKEARKKGLKNFDFWGIAPESAPESHPWAGFTEFKKTFHGEPKCYLGTYDLPIISTKYKIYKSLRTINRIRRKA